MKYDADIHPDNSNTSHGLVMDLIGSDKRVLDVGCATGLLAQALGKSGNRVSGVEIDAEAAEVARPHLERLVIADLEEIDLVEEFGQGSFDVVVFADVLEHLRDPLTTLRQARTLLADNGYVVLSIPNVAHAAVRLSLLQGKFDYRPLGLLDETHLRFFTRSSLQDLLTSAGFIQRDVRRTTATAFETEIPLSPTDLPEGVLDRVGEDPDSATYQFVLSAMPIPEGGEAVEELLRTYANEARALREASANLARTVAQIPPHPVVGVLDLRSGSRVPAFNDIRLAITLSELRRRMSGAEVRLYALHDEPIAAGLDSEPARPLLPWDGERRDQLLSELDAVVAVTGHASDAARPVLADLSRTPMGVHLLGAGISDAPHNIVCLAHRLVDRAFLGYRTEYLKITGAIPTSSVVVGYSKYASDPSSEAFDALEAVARRAGSVSAPLDVTAGAIDVMACVAAASLIVTDCRELASLALALERPVLALTGEAEPELVEFASRLGIPAGTSSEIVALAEVAAAYKPSAAREVLERDADLMFDRLADDILVAGLVRTAPSIAQRIADLLGRIAALESVNDGLRRSLARERVALAIWARERRQDPIGETSLAPTPNKLQQQLSKAEREVEGLRDEIDRIYATRVMRTAQPFRRLYARLRSR